MIECKFAISAIKIAYIFIFAAAGAAVSAQASRLVARNVLEGTTWQKCQPPPDASNLRLNLFDVNMKLIFTMISAP